MPVAPPTPFLPTFRYEDRDQSLLIDADPTFDESFDSWPVSPRVPPPDIQKAGSETSSLRDGESSGPRGIEMMRADIRTTGDQASAKRSGGDSPLKSHIQKKVKPPTPIRDDFYTRRVKDSDRRSSLGPRELGRNPAVFPSLARSTSRGSVRSTASSSSADPFWSSKTSMDLAERRHISPAPTSRTFMPTPPRPHQPQLRDPSPSPTHPTLTRSSSSASTTQLSPLHRTVSHLSTASASRRTSISEKVTGFFSSLIRRTSSSMGGGESPVVVAAKEVQPAGWSADSELDQERRELELEEQVRAGDIAPSSGATGSDPASERLVHHNAPPAVRSGAAAPRLRLPPTLTRPAPRSLSTATRALQPKKTIPSNLPPPIASSSKITAGPNPHPRPQTKAAPALDHPSNLPHAKPTSSFTARALSRLPAPGKGSTSSSRPTTIRTTERASDIASKRETFERLAREAAEERAKSLAKFSAPPQRPSAGLKRTVPVKGSTPGKASRQRAEERARFEQGLRERHEEKRRRDEELQRAREDLERAEDKASREERVVWAKGLPEMYNRRGGTG